MKYKDRTYFGQHEEEKIINKYLNKNPNKEKGIYVDIGAGYPIIYSNTYYYYKRGWHGLLVDSFPDMDKHFKRIRPIDTFLSIAITNYNGEVKMYGRAMEGSLVGNRYNKNKIHPERTFKIKCITMDTLIKKYPSFSEPDFLNMDIETSEEKALSKCNFNIFKPRIICIEYPGEGIDHREIWGHYLTPFYDFKETFYNNAFYLRKEGI